MLISYTTKRLTDASILHYRTVEARFPYREGGPLGVRCLRRLESRGGGVFELRVHFGPGYRVYFGRDGKAVVILLCGGEKRSQSADIRRAKSYWKDYETRKRPAGRSSR
jgi:hypothetical protein